MAILTDCTDDQYWKIEAINSSSLKVFIEDPIMYYNKYIAKTLPYKQSDALDFGKALHCKVLEPEEFENRFIIKPVEIDLRNKAGIEWKKSIGQKTIVTVDDVKLIETLTKRALEIIPFDWYGANQYKEIALTDLYSIDEYVKCKVDWLLEFDTYVINCDVKTIDKIDDYTILRSINKYRYDNQLAFYEPIIENNYKKPVYSYWLFLAKSTGNARLINGTNFAKNAHAKTFEAVDRLLKAKATNRWISPYADVSELEIPEWFN